MWSVHSRTIDGLPRTNNVSEGYNNGLKQSLKAQYKYLNPKTFTEVLVLEESQALVNHAQFMNRKGQQSNYLTSHYNQRMVEMMKSYDSFTHSQFVHSAASHFQFPSVEEEPEEAGDNSDSYHNSDRGDLSSDTDL